MNDTIKQILDECELVKELLEDDLRHQLKIEAFADFAARVLPGLIELAEDCKCKVSTVGFGVHPLTMGIMDALETAWKEANK